MPGTEGILRGVLDEWKAGVDRHDPEAVAAAFTDDAIFQGLHPYSVGRRGVFDYYDSQPVGLTVEYRFHETRRLSADVILAYLRADFTLPDGTPLPLNLSVVVAHGAARWRIAFYQVSPLTE